MFAERLEDLVRRLIVIEIGPYQRKKDTPALPRNLRKSVFSKIKKFAFLHLHSMGGLLSLLV